MQSENEISASAINVKNNARIGEIVFAIGNVLAKLEPGALAQLRRESGDSLAPRPPYFWRLHSRHPELGRNEDAWLRIIRIMAVLTEKGDPDSKQSPHCAKSIKNNYLGIGASLCDGGDSAWGAGDLDPRPMLSELRFARLLVSTGTMRADLLERAARALAAKRPSVGVGFDCTDIAMFLLFEDNPKHGQRLARDYYARLDRGHTDNAPETNT